MQIFIDDCAYPEYVFRVPVMTEISVPRYRTDAQKLSDAYLDAIIPASFKNKCVEINMPMASAVEIGWDKRANRSDGTERVKVWLLPTVYCEAKEQKLIMDITISSFMRDYEELIKRSLAAALRARRF